MNNIRYLTGYDCHRDNRELRLRRRVCWKSRVQPHSKHLLVSLQRSGTITTNTLPTSFIYEEKTLLVACVGNFCDRYLSAPPTGSTLSEILKPARLNADFCNIGWSVLILLETWSLLTFLCFRLWLDRVRSWLFPFSHGW